MSFGDFMKIRDKDIVWNLSHVLTSMYFVSGIATEL